MIARRMRSFATCHRRAVHLIRGDYRRTPMVRWIFILDLRLRQTRSRTGSRRAPKESSKFSFALRSGEAFSIRFGGCRTSRKSNDYEKGKQHENKTHLSCAWISTETSRCALGILISRTVTRRPPRRERCSISSSSTGQSRFISRSCRRSRSSNRGEGMRDFRGQGLQPGRHLGIPHGRQDARAHREHRDRLRHGLSRPEDRRPDRRGSPAENARRGDGHAAALSRRHRPARAGQGQGRQVSLSAAGLQGRGAGGILRRQVADVQRQLLPPRLQGGREDRSGRGADEADQGLSAGQRRAASRRWNFSTVRASRSTRSTPTP